MARADLVRPSRDGDQFHYHWAARQCLELLPGHTDLVAITIEGASTQEAKNDDIDAGEQLIDVGLYYGSEDLGQARLIRYVQLKHSTRARAEPWTVSGLKKTIKGFADRYAKLAGRFSNENIAQRFQFEFTTNRPIDPKIKEALADFASGTMKRHLTVHQALLKYTGLDEDRASNFLELLVVDGEEDDLWEQRHLLAQDLGAYLPDADCDAPIQLKDLITRKATTEFESDPSVRRNDVLRALKASEEVLQPAPCLISDSLNTLPRDQEPEILRGFLAATSPLIIHADGGVGKSVLASRLAAGIPADSEVVLYDCFGDGLYRSSLYFRHRHRDALVQIANELAAKRLCHPLVPTAYAETKQYMRAFIHRLTQAIGVLKAKNSEAHLCLIIDAADNAEMAAKELGESSSFVRDLIRTPLPEGVRLAFTCRTHRRSMLGAPLHAQELALRPFSNEESGRHLRGSYPSATDQDILEFSVLSSSNPRVQALVLSQNLPLQEMLRRLGPEPTTVDRAIGELLDLEIARLRDTEGAIEASQIEVICQGLAILRPLVPIPVLAKLSETSESAVRSFALSLSRPLLVKGNSLHFRDEPSETWFRERFKPESTELSRFLERLRPLATQSSYAAAALPQLLLEAGNIVELVALALSGEGLPSENPLEKRDVEVQRLIFALKACLQQKHYLAAAKLAFKSGAECAGEQRQNNLIQENTDIASQLMAPDRVEEIVSRRVFGSTWMGSHHAYDAGILSGREEFSALASSRLRMTLDWLGTWARLPEEERRHEDVSHADRTEIALAILRLRGPAAAAHFLRRWRPRRIAFEVGCQLGRRLTDLCQYEKIDALTEAAGNDIWLLLGLIASVSDTNHAIPAPPLARLLRLLADRRVELTESEAWNTKWIILDAIRSALEVALRVLRPKPDAWARILQRYLPPEPPSDLSNRLGVDRTPLLRAYALDAALRGKRVSLRDVAPSEVREQLDSARHYGHSQERDTFQREVGGLLPWIVLSAEMICGRHPKNLAGTIEDALEQTSAAESRMYREDKSLRQAMVLEWLRVLRAAALTNPSPQIETLKSWLYRQQDPLWPNTLTALCHKAARATGFESLAVDFASQAYQLLEASREHAESRTDSYLELSRAILAVNPAEARVYFDRAVDIASRIGDENLDRWAGFLHLAKAAGEQNKPRPHTAYRLSRIAELTYEYVARDKHFDWNGSADALTDLCASSALSILSRWRDRRFGDPARLLPLVIYRLVARGQLPKITPVVLSGIEARWDRLSDLKHLVTAETNPSQRALFAKVAYRYIRVQSSASDTWSEIKNLGSIYGLEFPDIDRLVTAAHKTDSDGVSHEQIFEPRDSDQERRSPNWDTIFQDIDLTDPGALRSAYAELHNYDPPFEFESFYREAFARVRVGQEPQLIHAISAWPDLGVFELRYLLDAMPQRALKQISVKNALKDLVLSVCRREPEWIKRCGWGMSLPFEKLDAEGLVPDKNVVHAILEGFLLRVDKLDAGGLFQLIDPLAECLSPEEADEALNFGFDLLEEVLRPEDGDGLWRPELQPPESLVSALAGYVWAGLGAPEASERWQCAHAVRSIVELGWSELLEELVCVAESDAGGPFIDQALPFYVWHARLWLLIGLARGGIDNPSALLSITPVLRRWLNEDHVLIRELSAQTLRTVLKVEQLHTGELEELASINSPSLPEKVYEGWLDPVDDKESVGEEVLNDDEKYYFGIDIGPYWFAPLGRAFGLTQKAIERRARQALRKHMAWKGENTRRGDPRYLRRIFGDRETSHSHGELPRTDDLCAYHGYHAMMFVAAGLLREKPVRRRTDDPLDEFHDWLLPYLPARIDGGWLADRRDPRLVEDPPLRGGYKEKNWCWGVTKEYIDQKLSADDGSTVLWGHWNGGKENCDETVSIRSAFASESVAEALVAALQTATELNRFSLPSFEMGDDKRAAPFKLRGWVSQETIPPGLDRGDPWSENLEYPGPAPSESVIRRLELEAPIDGSIWKANDAGMLRSETWTQKQGYGLDEETVPGTRLCANREFLRHLLAAHPDDRLIVGVSVRRLPPKYGPDRDMFEPYPWPYVRYYLMEDDGVAHAL